MGVYNILEQEPTILLVRLTRAPGAQAVQSQGMLRNAKPRRGELTKVIEASGHVKNTVAFLTLEMVMMSLVGALVSSRLTGHFN
jgi:hypothetical protein